MVSKYPEIVHVFVRDNCTKMTDEELARVCNEHFGTEFTESKMRAFRYNHGYKNERPNHLTKEQYMKRHYPAGMYEYIRDNSWGVSSKEMAERVNDLFGMNWTPVGIKQFRQRHGIKSGVTGWYHRGHEPGNKGKKLEEYVKDPERVKEIRQKMSATQFKKGVPPLNEKPIGAITVRKLHSRRAGEKSEYKFIKVRDDGSCMENWALLHRKVWEDHNGPIPEGMYVLFKDGDRMNCDISNLMLASIGEVTVMSKKGLRFEDPDLTETALHMVRLQQAANKRRKNGKA